MHKIKVLQQCNGTAHFLTFSMIKKGAAEKVLQFIVPFKSIYNQNLDFIKQKMYFDHYRESQTIQNLLIFIIFVMKIFIR